MFYFESQAVYPIVDFIEIFWTSSNHKRSLEALQNDF